METDTHYLKLERMYLAAPTNTQIYTGITLEVAAQKAVLTLPVDPKYFHAAGAAHGSVYFKMLDDAAFFAVQSAVRDVFVYTVSFNTQLLRPITGGVIRAVGELQFQSKNLFIADAVLYDHKNRVAGRGTGQFMKSTIDLTDTIGYE